MGRTKSIGVLAVDRDALHIDALKRACDGFDSVEMVVCESMDEVNELSFEPHLVLVNMNEYRRCTAFIVYSVLERFSNTIVLCYHAKGSVLRFADKQSQRIVLLPFDKIQAALIECIGSMLKNGSFSVAGERLFPPEHASLINQVEKLSPRELDILCLLGKGYGSIEMAEILTSSPNTVDTHMKNMRAKLKLANIVELRLLAGAYSRLAYCRTFYANDSHICSCRDGAVGSCPLK